MCGTVRCLVSPYTISIELGRGDPSLTYFVPKIPTEQIDAVMLP